MIEVRPARDDDRAWVLRAAREVLGSHYQVSLRRQFAVTDGDVLVAERDGVPVGFLTWELDGDACEALAIGCTEPGIGAGRALMERLHDLAREHGCTHAKVVTTDANESAQGFYVHLGYAVSEIRPGAADECRRRYKPEIPSNHHDEIEYARNLQ